MTDHRPPPWLERHGPHLLLAAAVLFLATMQIRYLLVGAPLGWDEAVYATHGRRLLAGGGPFFGLHRSVGMTALGATGTLLGGSDTAMRVVPCAFVLATLLVSFRLGAVAFDRATAAIACVVVLATTTLVYRCVDLLPDLPAAALLLGAMSLLLAALHRPGRPRLLYGAAVLIAAAFYVRYGSVLAGAVTDPRAELAGRFAVDDAEIGPIDVYAPARR